MTVWASLPWSGTAVLKRVLQNRSFYHPTFCMISAASTFPWVWCIILLAYLTENAIAMSLLLPSHFIYQALTRQ